MIRDGIRRAFSLALRRRERWEREVEEEIKLHLALRADQLATAGMSDDEAHREAVRRFGPLSETRSMLLDAAHHRETQMQRTEFVADARQDVAFAIRTLARQKSWAAITIATLALGIGATTAVFSVVSTLLLHPLAFPHANRIVYVYEQPASGNNTGISVSITPAAKVIRAWRQNARSFEAMEPSRSRLLSLKTATDDGSRVRTTAVLPTFPDFAGSRPIAGRMFTDKDIVAGGRVALLGETFWRERLGGSRSALGQLITIGDSTYAVIGVMPASLRINGPGSRPTDVWLPLDLRDEKAAGQILARLRPGVSPDVARRELDSIDARALGATSGNLPFRAVVATPAEQVRFRSSLYLLAAAVALVLLVACVNVAHLLLARSATRQREMAVRAALGAGRGRLLRQLLTESLMLSVAGTVAGIGVGLLGVRALIAFRPTTHDELKATHLDATTLAIAIGVALVSGVIFGIIGAVQSSRWSTHDALKAGAANASAGARHRRLRSVLVVSEMALSAMLVVGSALVVRSLASLQRTDLGFDPRGLYGLDLTFQSRALPPAARAQLLNEFATRVRSLPGVRALTVSRAEPGSRWFAVGRLEIEGEPRPAKTATSFIDLGYVASNYFATMGIALREGTNFTDTTVAAQQVIINESFARKHWAPGKAVGHRLRIADTDSEPWFTVVGVAHDALTDGPMAESGAPFFYVPVDSARGAQAVLVRVSGGAAVLAPAVAIGKQMGIRDVGINGVERFIGETLSEPRFVTMVMTVFGAIGLILAAIGLYGVMSYTITQQTREIGIRVALGAPRSDVVNRVLRRGAALAAAGATFGLLAAGWGTKLIETQLHGVERLDPISFAVGAVVLVGAALAACVVPARRALAVDPITAIRAE